MMVEEEVVRLFANGEQVFEWRCTPSDLDALILGRLYCEAVRREPRVQELPSADGFADLFRALFAAVDAEHESGGMHAAALVRDSKIEFVAADVGRHNAVDKAIGKALLAGEDVSSFGMIITARVSGEIARKCANSGVAWLASRSIPTTLAVHTALMNHLPIVGRAASNSPHRYQ